MFVNPLPTIYPHTQLALATAYKRPSIFTLIFMYAYGRCMLSTMYACQYASCMLNTDDVCLLINFIHNHDGYLLSCINHDGLML